MRGIWGFNYNIPKAIFYLLKGDYRLLGFLCEAYDDFTCISMIAIKVDP